jgi:hypothetical protein
MNLFFANSEDEQPPLEPNVTQKTLQHRQAPQDREALTRSLLICEIGRLCGDGKV